MDAIQYMVSSAKRTIPDEILSLAFRPPRSYITNISIDMMIEKNVIVPWVMTDLNILGGTEIVIPLDSVEVHTDDPNGVYIEIPEAVTSGRAIISVLSIVSNTTYQTYDTGTATGKLDANLGGHLSGVHNTMIERISERGVFIYGDYASISGMMLRLIVEYSSRLAEINPRSYKHLEKIATHAVKAYIYKTLIVKMNKAELYNGHELSIIKDIVDRYEDEYEKYTEHIDGKIRKVLFINDTIRMRRFVSAMIPNTY